MPTLFDKPAKKQKFELRDYQIRAFEAIKGDLVLKSAGLVVMPTASGKSHVIAAAATLLDPVLILQPSQELLAQNMAKLALIVPEAEIGVYSASFGRKEIRRYTFATIQSVYKKPELFRHIKLVIVDEAHGVAVKSLGTMYKDFFAGIGNPKILGFTATPYRLEIGYYRDNEGGLIAATMLKLLNRMRNKREKEIFWRRIIFQIPHRKLLAEGYLSPILYVTKPLVPYMEIPVNQSHSDYNLEAYANSIVGREAEILNTITEAQKRFKSVLVFCATTDQVRHFTSVIKGSGMVLGDSDKGERRRTVEDFKSGKIKTVFNFGTLTTGFDHPGLDCIILLRPTRSLPLYNQMIGRVTRIAPGKEVGTVIDLTGTVNALGRIETFELYRNHKDLWDLKTEKHPAWHDKVLFTRAIDK